MTLSAITLSCVCLCFATPTVARAAIRFDPLRLVSVVDPTVEPGATPNGDSFGMQVASDGAWVLFVSDSSNVSTNLHRGQSLDLYLYERTNHKTTLISVDAAGGADLAYPTISHDGKWVIFDSFQSGFVAELCRRMHS